ncbi:MAG: hypothetical protein FIA99_12370 [Ruminiclostridium sp.]|nr:hypothetical protein [Ruminiclostridium sp.]
MLIDEAYKSFIKADSKNGMVKLNVLFNEISNFMNIKQVDAKQINKSLLDLEEAMKIPDYIKIADILKFSLKPILKSSI